tara:strand:- start:593 stop:1432 length:840 start_codon:yes stop_codon:yes gene_type:complete
MSIGKFIKDFAPVIIGAATGGAGTGLGSLFSSIGLENPILQKAVIGGLTTKAFGGKDKDAVRNMLLSGLGGAFFDDTTTQRTMQDGTNVRSGLPSGSRGTGEFLDNRGRNEAARKIMMDNKPPVESALERIAGTPRTFSGELLKAGGISDDNLLARLLNTRVGEGLTAGLIAQLLAGDDDEERPREFEQRPFGFGGPGGRLGGIRFAADGGLSDPMSFPRRNGGIDPSEGSGTKDDVPAMLMAGEFVLTKDAVKGLGDGNQRKGIQRAYNMMDKLEARA